MKILCCGDVHIGRRSSRLPETVEGRTASCASCWTRVVDHALSERVDVVALSGDVVDRENRFYEATGPLERGVRRLAEAGVVTVAVAGNHDHDVLPRLAEGIEGAGVDRSAFRLLGAGGRWERTTIEAGGEAIHVVGWSFPEAVVRESPLVGLRRASASASAGARGAAVRGVPGDGAGSAGDSASAAVGDAAGGGADVGGADVGGADGGGADAGGAPSAAVPDDDAPVLGLLHADLDQPGSRYAPVTLAELRAAPIDFWLLGHVHAPRLYEAEGGPPVLYPGSPQAMDPGESGAHGVWVLETEPGRRFRARRVQLSTVRYDAIEVDVDGVADADTFDRRVTDAVRAHLATVAEEAGALRYLSCRLRITGRTALHRELDARVRRLCADLELDDGGVTAVVERVDLATRPARDLAELARGTDPVGIVARLLRALERGADGAAAAVAGSVGARPGGGAAADGADAANDVAYDRLLRDAAMAVDDVHRARPYLSIAEDGVDPAPIARRALARQASLLLDELLAQKEDA